MNELDFFKFYMEYAEEHGYSYSLGELEWKWEDYQANPDKYEQPEAEEF